MPNLDEERLHEPYNCSTAALTLTRADSCNYRIQRIDDSSFFLDAIELRAYLIR